MTGQEVWKAWEKNLSAKFKSNSNDHVMVIVNGIPRWEHNDKEVAIYSFMNHCWQPVKQPVTWQEAIQAWGTGKIVSVDVGGCKFKLTHDDTIFGLSERMINLGTWYVED